MALWIEVRCDCPSSDDCFSASNRGPKRLSRNILRDTASMIREAVAEGWFQNGNSSAICPACKPGEE